MAPEKGRQQAQISCIPRTNASSTSISISFGWERTGPAHSYGPHARNHYLFHYIIAGRGVLLANDQEYAVGPGHGFLVVPGQITTTARTRRTRGSIPGWSLTACARMRACTWRAWAAASPFTPRRSAAAGRRLQDEMLYNRQPQRRQPHPPDRPRLPVSGPAGAGFGGPPFPQRAPPARLLHQEALTFIEQNFQRDISIEQIAAVCGLNRSYFAKVFRDAVGESPQAYLLHYPHGRAAQLLKENAPAHRRDRRPGQLTPTSCIFARVQNVHGVSPREYRQTHFLQTK